MRGAALILAAVLLVVFIVTPNICAKLEEREHYAAAFIVEWIGSILAAALLVATVIVWTLQ